MIKQPLPYGEVAFFIIVAFFTLVIHLSDFVRIALRKIIKGAPQFLT